MLARIFRPLRRQPATSGGAEAAFPAKRARIIPGRPDNGRVGGQAVTNAPPSGLQRTSVPRPGTEESWMALLELVFAVTGWPDA